MSILDNNVINTFEKASSSDVNELQNLRNRLLAECMRTLTIKKQMGGTPTPSNRAHVASGLFVTTDGSQLTVGTGALFQEVTANPPDVPTPEALDSSYRIGLNLSAINIADPATASDRYWLIEARVVRNVTLTETRDIFNQTTQSFQSQNVPKRQESQIETQVVEGTATAMPTQTVGWAPLALVFRPAGGGTITGAQITQMSTQINDFTNVDGADGVASRSSFRFKTNGDIAGTTANTGASFVLAAEINGQQLFARTDQDVNLRETQFVDPLDSGVRTSDEYWWYIYLTTTSNNITPSNLYGSDIEHRGRLIVSRTPPDLYGRNSAALGGPLPIGGSIAAGEAAFVGVFRADGTANYEFIDVSKSGRAIIDGITVMSAQGTPNYGNGLALNLNNTGAGSTELTPFGCNYTLRAETIQIDTTPSANAYGYQIRLNDATGQISNTAKLGVRDHDSTIFDASIRTLTGITVSANSNTATGAVGTITDLGDNTFFLRVIGLQIQ
ncbi:MAG: hypothetical protein MJE68_10050 [Proteobacteria bacterium]|nr:hypothetical protein [Pseudomonadota bacterium]